MTQPPDDREIRSMLEARADRVRPAAAAEIRAAVAARIEWRRGGLDVPVRPVVIDRPPLGRRAWWGAGLAAALVVALSGLLIVGVPSTSTPDGTPGSGSPSVTAAASAQASPPVSVPDGLTVSAFRVELATGRLNGRVVLLTGSLKVTPIRCLGPTECQLIEVVGLAGVGVSYWSSTASPADVRARIEAHPGPALMAFRVEVTDLVLLGWPIEPPETALAVRELGTLVSGIGGDDLAIVSGWLVGGSSTVECPAPTLPWRCPGAEPWLTGEPPGSDGKPKLPDEVVNVGVDPSIALADRGHGLGSAPDVMTGPFLVRFIAVRGWASPYQVIARLDPASMIRLGTISPSEPVGSAAPSEELSAAELRAALDDGSLTDRLVVVDGSLLSVAAIPCPVTRGPQCVTLYLRGLEGILVVAEQPLASVMDSPTPASGHLMFRGGPGVLTYLGTAPDDLDHPVTVAQLLASSTAPGADALEVVSGWLVVGGIHSCPVQLEGATPCPGPPPWLTDDRPFDDGMLASNEGASVALTVTMSVQTATRVVSQGPFLVRRVWKTAICDAAAGVDCSGAQWQVVAAFDPLAVVRAQVP
jgi:hypothetical protein